ncbi:helix-turn-helix domain-containing protein [Actinomadura sp. 21ATH]|uniref:helix-turn-helix domain-containing protein n=1 Tax=Actinomadura sp. 21ATH TaxID=1735444 RepID=UPI0035C26870
MDKDLTPLGSLLEEARQAVRPKLSQNALAQAAETSSTTYRRIIHGVARFGGQDTPFEGTPEAIAKVARVLNVTAEQLEIVGRPDAARELETLAAQGEAPLDVARREAAEKEEWPTEEDVLRSGLSEETKRELLDLRRHVERWMEAGDESAIRLTARMARAYEEERGEADAG